MFTVTTPVADRTLLTPEELRSAVGAADASSDGELQSIGDRVAAIITRHCNVAADGTNPPTLRKETVQETIRADRCRSRLILSRRPIVSVTSVVERGTALAAEDFEIHAGAGLLARLSSDELSVWPAGKIVVTYDAGFETVPDDLKQAAAKLARLFWSERTRDPLVKQEEIPGVLTTSYWVGGLGEGSLPPDIEDLLAPYRNLVL